MPIIDVIKYEDENNTLIYRHPETDFNLGSQLIVHESQEAVLFKDGEALQSFGAGRHTLDTNNFPFIKGLIKAITGGKTIFHCEIYFINLVSFLDIKWGTDSKIRMFDPVSGLHLEIGASGVLNLRVIDGRKLLLKVVGTSSSFERGDVFGTNGYSIGQASGSFRGMIVSKVKTILAKQIREKDINILEVDEHYDELSQDIKVVLNSLFENYGVEITEFFITTIQTPDEDPNFIRLREQHAERYLKVQHQRIRKAEAEAKQEAEIVEAETKAKTAVIIAEGEAMAEVARGKGHGEALRAQGADYGTESARIIGTAAASNEGGGAASEVAKAAIGIGVGVSVAGQVAQAIKPIFSEDGTWECPSCAHKGNKGLFCEQCGAKKNYEEAWECPNCHSRGLTSNFCPNCGQKRDE